MPSWVRLAGARREETQRSPRADPEEGSAANGGAVTLEAADFAFQPASVRASSGDTIRLRNADDAKHNLTVGEAGIDEDVDAGATTTVSLEDVEAGTDDFICEFHPSMKGTLEVTR